MLLIISALSLTFFGHPDHSTVVVVPCRFISNNSKTSFVIYHVAFDERSFYRPKASSIGSMVETA